MPRRRARSPLVNKRNLSSRRAAIFSTEKLHASGGEFNRQGYTVQTMANFSHRRSVLLRHSKCALCCNRTFDEKPHRIVLR